MQNIILQLSTSLHLKVYQRKNMRKTIALLIFLGFMNVVSDAQQVKINGVLIDKISKNVIKGSTLTLITQNDNAVLKSAVSDTSGEFNFKNVANGNYDIVITSIGYKKLSISIIVDGIDKNLGNIIIEREGKELSEVTVVANAPAVSQKDDTSQYSANQYKVNPDATTEDLVKKMPGISIDKNGTITAHGEQVKKVTVDGKDFFGDDASAALKNIPASVVDKVQVFDKLSDQAQLTGIDDGNAQKSINIITKAGINNAQFGRVYAGFGTDKTYSAGGNVSVFKKDRRLSFVGNFNNINQQNFGSQDLLGISGNNNTSRSPMSQGNFRGPGGPSENFTVDQASGINTTNAIGVNYSDKWNEKATITASYFFNETRNNNLSTTNTNIFEGNLTTFKESNAASNNFNHRINARLEYKLDTNNILFIIPSLNFQKNNSTSLAYLNSYKNTDDSLYNSGSSSIKGRNGYNLKNNIMFRHSFAKKNRIFSVGFNTAFTRNYSENTNDGKYRYFDNNGNAIIPDSLQQQLSDNKTNGNTIGGTITYNEPLGKKGKGQLQLEYSPSVQKTNANQQTFGFNGQTYSEFDSVLSNQFNNIIFTNTGGITYRITPSKDEQIAFGVNYQTTNLKNDRVLPTVSNVNQSFRNFLPNGYWRKKISKYSNIRMFYRASTIYPTIAQLQDVINLTNPLNVSGGNSELKQSYTQYGGGRFSYTNTKNNKSLFTGIFFQSSNDFISNATYFAANDSVIQEGVILRKGSQFTKPINLDGYKMVRSYFNYSLPVKAIKTTLNLNTSFMYSNLPGLINSITTTTKTFQYNLGLAFVSNVSEYIDYNISYNAAINNARTTGTTTTNNNYVNHTVSVVFNLLSKKGWFLQNDLTGQIYNGLSEGFDRSFILWNASIGKKFFKNKTGEIKVSCFDILKQNQSISRTITNTTIEDAHNIVLKQFFMLTFSYNLKNFGTPKKQDKTDDFIPRVAYPN